MCRVCWSPQAFKIIPNLRNWEDVLYLTEPGAGVCACVCGCEVGGPTHGTHVGARARRAAAVAPTCLGSVTWRHWRHRVVPGTPHPPPNPQPTPAFPTILHGRRTPPSLPSLPESWSVHAVYQATRLFVSNLNARLAQRFLALVLLPRVRYEIRSTKKLHFALFQALRKATYKPGAFYKVRVGVCCWHQNCGSPMCYCCGAVINSPANPLAPAPRPNPQPHPALLPAARRACCCRCASLARAVCARRSSSARC